MPPFLTDTNPPSAIVLDFCSLNDETCTNGYRELRGAEVPHLGNLLENTPKRALSKLPDEWTAPPPTRGIYRFEIETIDPTKPEIYIGKSSSLRSRLADYVEMTRRLLGLYHSHPMWADKNAFRYVHFRLADALITRSRIKFFYLSNANITTNQDLARLELLETSAATLSYHQPDATKAHHLVLNAFDSLRSPSHMQLSETWARVQALLNVRPLAPD